jgi:hypothetical protein
LYERRLDIESLHRFRRQRQTTELCPVDVYDMGGFDFVVRLGIARAGRERESREDQHRRR